MKEMQKACKGMSKKWKSQEQMEHGVTPCSKEWLVKEMEEPWHKSLAKGKKMDLKKWISEEHKEHKGRK